MADKCSCGRHAKYHAGGAHYCDGCWLAALATLRIAKIYEQARAYAQLPKVER